MLLRETGLCLKLLQSLAGLDLEVWTSVPALIKKLGIQRSHGTKLVQRLVKLNYVSTRRGSGGGVRLHIGKKDNTFLEVARDLGDPFVQGSHCVMGGRPCDAVNHCPLHKAWKAKHAKILELLETPFTTTLQPSPDC
ncbi:MAG: hypothetical protein GY822_20660 [Deltaproteobacteria bacterium]|nr:hypothetical protein [Deltaproteobacteria bacterium]